MRKFLSLAVMCSLAFPAMALAQPEAPKEAADDMDAEYGESTPTAAEERPQGSLDGHAGVTEDGG